MRSPFSTIIAIVSGLIVLVGFFLPIEPLVSWRTQLINWAVILSGVAGLVAIVHLISVHWHKLTAPHNRQGSSLFFLLAFAITFGAGLLLKPNHPTMQKVITHIQVPIEASLMGVLTVSLTFAAIRLFQRRTDWMTVLFAVSAIVFLVLGSGYLSTFSNIPILKDILAAVNALPVAGARGMMMGIALGGMTTGLRVLIGADRPYSG
jgi:hypothetical protein